MDVHELMESITGTCIDDYNLRNFLKLWTLLQPLSGNISSWSNNTRGITKTVSNNVKQGIQITHAAFIVMHAA